MTIVQGQINSNLMDLHWNLDVKKGQETSKICYFATMRFCYNQDSFSYISTTTLLSYWRKEYCSLRGIVVIYVLYRGPFNLESTVMRTLAKGISDSD